MMRRDLVAVFAAVLSLLAVSASSTRGTPMPQGAFTSIDPVAEAISADPCACTERRLDAGQEQHVQQFQCICKARVTAVSLDVDKFAPTAVTTLAFETPRGESATFSVAMNIRATVRFLSTKHLDGASRRAFAPACDVLGDKGLEACPEAETTFTTSCSAEEARQRFKENLELVIEEDTVTGVVLSNPPTAVYAVELTFRYDCEGTKIKLDPIKLSANLANKRLQKLGKGTEGSGSAKFPPGDNN